MSFKSWLLETESSQHKLPHDAGEFEAPYRNDAHAHKTHPWTKVMCLTGVDYFSSLAYQQSIAVLAAGALVAGAAQSGALAPIATLILVLLTLFGAVPIYSRVAKESPHGEGSVAMLERLLRGWKGKLFVLVLLGFAATDFVITITLSAADAAAHIIENPYAHEIAHGHQIGITLFLIAMLGAVFLKGFKEAIGIAVGLVAIYLTLNTVVVFTALNDLIHHPDYLNNWKNSLTAIGSPSQVLGKSLLLFPALALGLSGFETGVAVMPLVASKNGDIAERIKNSKKLLLGAALIMSFFLLTASFSTALIIPFHEFQKGGDANGRALAYLAHKYFGDTFGTIYDISTISILWFAGSSAMAALLNLVPRYLPRYGMAPEWARASRPLALVFTGIAFIVTLIFKADVDAQGGAYATGVLVLITSASFATTLAAKAAKEEALSILFGTIGLIFLYTTIQNIHERPEGIKIAGAFILTIIVLSMFSRIYRTTELRVERFDIDELAQRFINDACTGNVRLIANEPNERDEEEYRLKEKEQREDNHIPTSDPVIFVEVTVADASDFGGTIEVRGEERFGYRILRVRATTIPNAIAALLLHIRDSSGLIPHVYFAWTEGNPFVYLLKYIALGQGDIAPITREILRENEPDPEKRPSVHVGG